jgi:hypothetical protein
VATVVVAAWEGDIDRERAFRVLNGEVPADTVSATAALAIADLAIAHLATTGLATTGLAAIDHGAAGQPPASAIPQGQ